MKRAWKPGDVGSVLCSDGERRTAMHYLYMGRWTWAFGDSSFRDADTSDARPLVVIDPEDPAAVQRLVDALYATSPTRKFSVELDWLAVQSALRSLTAPPKPDEPTGLGAVVEDERGELWVRRSDDCRPVWINAKGATSPVTWLSIAAVRVLSEGVTS